MRRYFFVFFDDTKSNPQHIIEAFTVQEALAYIGQCLGLENYKWTGKVGVYIQPPIVNWND